MYPSVPVVDQPRFDNTPLSDGWGDKPGYMPQSPAIIGDLENLANVTQISLKQQFNLCECITGFEKENKYEGFTKSPQISQKMYFVQETSNCCLRNTLGKLHPFQAKIFDKSNKNVINIERPFNCQGCCFPCCLQEMKVFSTSTNEFLGTIKEDWNILFCNYTIKDPNGKELAKIKGPIFTCSLPCRDVDFRVLINEREVAKIVKNWSGCLKECCTDTDDFTLDFYEIIDVKLKAMLLATAVHIDYMYYERGGALFLGLGYCVLATCSQFCNPNNAGAQ